MKKILSVLVIVSGLLLADTKINAQNKIGYMSVDQMVGLMPEVARIDTALQIYQRDSLNSTFAVIVQDYNYKDSMLTKTDTLKTPKSVINQWRIDLQNDGYQIQNWQGLSQQAMQSKQEELLGPVYAKVIAALKQVAKDKGYSYVLTKDAFLVAPDTDDLLPFVAAKLGVKIPTGTGTQPISKPPARPAGH
jgi:outer membrane protein